MALLGTVRNGDERLMEGCRLLEQHATRLPAPQLDRCAVEVKGQACSCALSNLEL